MLFDALLVKPCWFKTAGLFQCRHQIFKFLCSSRITSKDWKIISRPLLQCCTGNSFSSENKSAKMVHNKQVRRKCQSIIINAVLKVKTELLEVLPVVCFWALSAAMPFTFTLSSVISTHVKI